MFCGSWHARRVREGACSLGLSIAFGALRLQSRPQMSGQNFYLKSDIVPLIKILSFSPHGHHRQHTEILV